MIITQNKGLFLIQISILNGEYIKSLDFKAVRQ